MLKMQHNADGKSLNAKEGAIQGVRSMTEARPDSFSSMLMNSGMDQLEGGLLESLRERVSGNTIAGEVFSSPVRKKKDESPGRLQYLPEVLNLVEVPEWVITKQEIDVIHIPHLRDFKIDNALDTNRDAFSITMADQGQDMKAMQERQRRTLLKTIIGCAIVLLLILFLLVFFDNPKQ